MYKLSRITLAIALAALAATSACQKGKEGKDGKDQQAAAAKDAGSGAAAAKPRTRQQIPPPMNVAQPPADAQKSASGMAFKILTEGTDQTRPTQNDAVEIHYTVWKPNGETMFTTASRNAPQQAFLPQMPPGWVETLTDMKIGEKRLVWMPPELAYKNAKSGPQETMAYQIELVKVEPAPPVPEDVAAAPADAKKTAKGVSYKVLTPGTGTDKPRPWDQVMIKFTGWTSEGKLVETTEQRKRPQPVQLFRAPDAWTEALTTMVQGQKNRVWIPAELAKGRPGVPENVPLVYDFEIVSITKMPEPPPVPKDVAAPPANAKKTEKGVSYKVLKPGTGKEHPRPDQMVVVDYTGWTTDGKMFDSSVIRGRDARFPLNGVIPGWTDGLQTMVVGETTRFWIPEELAYKGRPNAPQGMLVFDVTLKEIINLPKPQVPPGHPPMGGAPGGGLGPSVDPTIMTPPGGHGGLPPAAKQGPGAAGQGAVPQGAGQGAAPQGAGQGAAPQGAGQGAAPQGGAAGQNTNQKTE